MTLRVDLEKLEEMSKSLHSLRDEAIGLLGPGVMLDVDLTWTLSCVVEADKMASGVVDTLMPAVSGRLGEIGDLMHSVTVQFRKGDDADAPKLATTYSKSSGDWGLPR